MEQYIYPKCTTTICCTINANISLTNICRFFVINLMWSVEAKLISDTCSNKQIHDILNNFLTWQFLDHLWVCQEEDRQSRSGCWRLWYHFCQGFLPWNTSKKICNTCSNINCNIGWGRYFCYNNIHFGQKPIIILLYIVDRLLSSLNDYKFKGLIS